MVLSPHARAVAFATFTAILFLVGSSIPGVAGSARSSAGSFPREAPFVIVGPANASNVPPPLSGWWQIPTVGPAPSNRTFAQMVYDSSDQEVVLFGGCPGYALGGECRALDDTWVYWGGNWSNISAPGASPPARSSGMMADDPSHGGVLLFGGCGPNGTLNDTWEFSGGAWTQQHPATSPPPLAHAAMAYDPTDSELVLVGGTIPGNTSASYGTWAFNGSTWHNVTGTVHPPGWFSPFLAESPGNQGLVLVGGASAIFFPTYSSECWRFVGNVWTNITSTSGAAGIGSRIRPVGGFDPILNETLMYGGAAGVNVGGGLWAYGLNEKWTQLNGATDPPGAIYESQGAWDGWDGYLVDLGRVSIGSFYGIPTIQNVYNSTWALLEGLDTNNSSAPSSVVVSGNYSAYANATGGLPPYEYNWTFGDGTNATGANVTHSFVRTGNFNVTLAITDAVGQSARLVFPVVVAAGPANVLQGLLTPGSGTFDLLIASVGVAVVAVVAIVLLRRRSPPPAAPVARSTEIPTPSDGSGEL